MSKILSISIAAYNVEKFLKGTLDSLISDRETLDKMEIIIVNDGSKDNTSIIASEYCKEYPDCFVLIDKENGGYGSTINSALKVASGKYFRLLDGDDWYITENLKEYVAFLEKTEADMILSPYVEYREDIGIEEKLDRHNLECFKKYKIENIKVSELDDIKMHELAVKMNLMKGARFQITENCFYTDTEYVFLIFMFADSIVKFDKPVYKYRIGSAGQSVSISGRLKHSKDAEKVLDKILRLYINGKDTFSKRKQEVLWNTIKVVAWFQYVTYLLFDKSRESIRELKEYDKKISRIYKPLYNELGKESKVIRMLRLTGYMTYEIARKRVMKKLDAENQ